MPNKKPGSLIIFFIDIVLVAVVIVMLILLFFFQSYKVERESMIPTLHPGDHILCARSLLFSSFRYNHISGHWEKRLRLKREQLAFCSASIELAIEIIGFSRKLDFKFVLHDFPGARLKEPRQSFRRRFYSSASSGAALTSSPPIIGDTARSARRPGP